MKYPVMFRIKQQFDTTSIEDVVGTIRREISQLDLGKKVVPGQRVAITAGSRGICYYIPILAVIVECFRNMELKPFIIPAMGSHGGATAEGQVKLLNDLGISESSVGAPIVSSMEVVSVGRLNSGAEVVIARDAIEADHLVIINRVKPHTAFRDEVESGLCKMLAVGCGKHQGALNMHKFGLAASIVPATKILLKKAQVLCGLAIVENSLEQINTLKLALPEQFVEVDRELLEYARKLLPRIPVEDLDILLVDEMGKNISGVGIDPNIIGFWRRDGGHRKPDYQTLIVLDLTPQSNGNALGIGMVDLTTRRVIEQIDLKSTYANVLTTGIWRSVRLPITLEDDKTVLEVALSHVSNFNQIRMVRIINTLRLETIWATEALLPELRRQKGVVVDETPLQLQFDKTGRLIPFNDRV